MSENETAPTGKAMYWTGVVVSAIPSLMLLMASMVAMSKSETAINGMSVRYGYPEGTIQFVGLACFVSTVLYIIPRTSVLGAVLLTGYLGGAVATHVHANEGPAFIFPVIFGVLVWGDLFLRDARIRALLPWRS